MRFCLVLAAVLVSGTLAAAQTFRGGIQGAVTATPDVGGGNPFLGGGGPRGLQLAARVTF